MTSRYNASATRLASGQVLVTGGSNGSTVAAAELYDPATGTWTATGAMTISRSEHTATLLNNGKVLVANGYTCCLAGVYLATAELYDPATGTWTATPTSPRARGVGKDVLLASGKVLITGGAASSSPAGPTSNVDVYDPSTNAWSVGPSLLAARYRHTATRLPSGKVLVAGGSSRTTTLRTVEVYDPATNAWTSGPQLGLARSNHSATLLPSGKVLVAGGGSTLTAELYDPATNTWAYTGSMTQSHSSHRAFLLPSGKVFLVDSFGAAEVYDPATGTWSATVSMAMTARTGAAVELLRSGQVLVAGGYVSPTAGYTATAELYDAGRFTWNVTAPLSTNRCGHTATLLDSGQVLVAGGNDSAGSLASAELYDPVARTWTPVGDMTEPRGNAVATLLPSGQVLVVGGNFDSTVTTSELYDPATGTWTATGSLLTARVYFTATVLASGQVLVTGGRSDGGIYPTSTELYDPATGTWSSSGNLATGRINHSAVLMSDGRVLIAGGHYQVFTTLYRLASTEVYTPSTGSWLTTSNLAQARSNFTLHLLGSGNPLAVGGLMGTGSYVGQGSLASAEKFQAVGVWASAGSMATPRHDHASAVLPSGAVLTAGGIWKIGGSSVSNLQASADLYDPATNAWKPTASMLAARSSHTLTPLPTGEVLAVGCVSGSALAEVYSP
ncbi:Kelch repeat-containing protein [Pyxidicoccus trucidator]|uniref:Kelch repeat-containing protein n=1 Tax=Pyxidicoccus trucidator TaxID=2709662 RepID=UPI001F087185|nr:kelch repeat-containing protein [Pyxidicoccus trucidator]